MAALLQYLLLLLPLAVFAQYGGFGTGLDMTSADYLPGHSVGEPPEPGPGVGGAGNGGLGPNMGGGTGPNTGGGTGPNMGGGTGNGGWGGGAGAGAGAGPVFPDYAYGGVSPSLEQYGGNGGRLAGGTTAFPGNGASQMDDYDSDEGSGSSEVYGGSEGGAWFGGGGLGLLKSDSQRVTVTVLSCLLAVAVIALIAFFIVKRKRGSSAAVANP